MLPASFVRDLLLPLASECLLVLHGVTLEPSEKAEDHIVLNIDIGWDNNRGMGHLIS